jgi:hypothetical protein
LKWVNSSFKSYDRFSADFLISRYQKWKEQMRACPYSKSDSIFLLSVAAFGLRLAGRPIY